jgi:hypothetical protein
MPLHRMLCMVEELIRLRQIKIVSAAVIKCFKRCSMGFHAAHGSPFAPRADLHFQVTESGLMQACYRV